jgi:hypothetical protein
LIHLEPILAQGINLQEVKGQPTLLGVGVRVRVRVALYTIVPSTNIKKRYHGISQFIQMNQSGFKAENENNSESKSTNSTISYNMSNSRYDINCTVTNAIAKYNA